MHILIALFIVFGWLLAPVVHAPMCIAVLTHWLLNKNRCILSEDYEDKNGFTTELLGKIGIHIENNELLKTLVPYILVSIPASISIYMALNNINICGSFAHNIGKYMAPIIPLVVTSTTLHNHFKEGIKEGIKEGHSVPPTEIVQTPIDNSDSNSQTPMTADEKA